MELVSCCGPEFSRPPKGLRYRLVDDDCSVYTGPQKGFGTVGWTTTAAVEPALSRASDGNVLLYLFQSHNQMNHHYSNYSASTTHPEPAPQKATARTDRASAVGGWQRWVLSWLQEGFGTDCWYSAGPKMASGDEKTGPRKGLRQIGLQSCCRNTGQQAVPAHQKGFGLNFLPTH